MRATGVYYGIEHDLASLIDTHLFVLCPNNSGGTFVKNALACSLHTWNLQREGQHTHGYVGPELRDSGRQLVWAAESRWIDDYRWSLFDWERTMRSWYAQAVSRSPTAWYRPR